MERLPLFAALSAAAVFATGAWVFAETLEDTIFIPLDDPAIQYSQQPSNDPVAVLEKRLESGKAKLDYSPDGWGYLPSVLKQLGINQDSQILVFSRTSIQTDHISPRTPRAIYFNDDAAVGYVQRGDELELTGLDAQRGVYLYTLDTVKSDAPRFGTREDCLRCHQGPVTLGVPGLMISSVHPNTSGPRESHGGAFMTDDRIPIAERWGGWYVTGTTGKQHHYGNNIALADPIHPGGPAGEDTQNLTSLAGFLDTSKYLVPTSDVVALMTLEHQSRMTNLLVRIGWDTRIALHKAKGGNMDDATSAKLDSEIGQLATYMLFANEAPLTSPIKGVSSFTRTFAQRGPRDRQGRSLRDFDL
ncbi:MAG TPA: hypothetical protein VFW94_14600, partial [Candidatus Acidoferrales bacterium]|nr:hypothetical protein [Candidatus Acidoferrales bacterium]